MSLKLTALKLTAFKLSQPIGEFYVSTMPACRLMNLAEADIRRITNRNIEEYSGIQRGLSPKRRKEIQSYIETVDATFPNSIILNLPKDKLEKEIIPIDCPPNFDIPNLKDIYSIEVKESQNTFEIIDGQHRLAGFTNDNCQGFDLLVVIFIDLLMEDQAYIFSVINLTQTKVNRSHVYDLFDLAETRSPEKTAHTIAKMLNSEEESPFYQRIKLLGNIPKADGEVLYKPILSQGTVVAEVLELISLDPKRDRNYIKQGIKVQLKGDEVERGLIFRRFFVEDQDWAIYKTMLNYFSAIKNNFRSEWEDQENPISRAIGYEALMRLLVPVFQQGKQEEDISFDYFNSVFSRAYSRYQEDESRIDFDNYSPSGRGARDLYNKFREWCGLQASFEET